jgi:hypothetical protein
MNYLNVLNKRLYIIKIENNTYKNKWHTGRQFQARAEVSSMLKQILEPSIVKICNKFHAEHVCLLICIIHA